LSNLGYFNLRFILKFKKTLEMIEFKYLVSKNKVLLSELSP